MPAFCGTTPQDSRENTQVGNQDEERKEKVTSGYNKHWLVFVVGVRTSQLNQCRVSTVEVIHFFGATEGQVVGPRGLHEASELSVHVMRDVHTLLDIWLP